MSNIRRRHNLTSTNLGAGLSNVDTAITFTDPLTEGGVDIATLGAGDHIPLTIDGIEVVWLTAYTSGATSGTILREPPGENTVAVAHSTGVTVQNNPTKLDFDLYWSTDGLGSDSFERQNGSLVVGAGLGAGSRAIETLEMGTFAGGYVNAALSGTQSNIYADRVGAFAFGYAYSWESGSTATIKALGRGSFAQGAVFGNENGADGTIEASGGSGAFARGGVYSDDTGSLASIRATSWGSFASGYAAAYAGGYSQVLAMSGASFAHGYAEAGGTGAIATLVAQGSGAFVTAYAYAYSAGSIAQVYASARGSFAYGYAYGGEGTGDTGALIEAIAYGAMSGGYIDAENDGSGQINAEQEGSRAGGFVIVDGSFSQGDILATGVGAFAYGYVSSEIGTATRIEASAGGSFAFGAARDGDTIEATAENAFQWGVGSNAEPDSLQVGIGIRLWGLTGDAGPGTLRDGDIWLGADNSVRIRSNGATVVIV